MLLPVSLNRLEMSEKLVRESHAEEFRESHVAGLFI